MNRDYTIIAVDFDGTLCECRYPEIGEPNVALIDQLKQMQSGGTKLILWTCRTDEHLDAAVQWCVLHGLVFDAINENIPEMVEYWGNDGRKVFADIYIDDKMVNNPNYCVPFFSDPDLTTKEEIRMKALDKMNDAVSDTVHLVKSKQEMIDELAKMYATSLVVYGVDLSNQYCTATSIAMSLNQAYLKGRQDERDLLLSKCEEMFGRRGFDEGKETTKK